VVKLLRASVGWLKLPGWTRFVVVGLLSILTPSCACFDNEKPPSLITNPAVDVSTDAATLGGTVLDFGGRLDRLDRRVHVCFSTDAAQIEWGAIQGLFSTGSTESRCRAGSGTEDLQSVRVTGLQPGTTYSFVAVLFYGTRSWDGATEDGHARGDVLSFTTVAPTPPTVSTGVVTGITTSGATVSGSVTSQGSGTVSERGICFGTAPDPSRSGSCVASGSGVGSFSAALGGLSPATRYYTRAFGVWSGGVAYGSSVEFTTLPLVQPGFTLTAQSASQRIERGQTGASIGLSVNRVGGFSGAVALSVTGLPTGVSATVQTPGAGNSGSVAFVVTSQAPLGTFALNLVGSATGLPPQSIPFSLIVADPPGLLLNVPIKLDMTQQGSTTAALSIVRTGGWTGNVSLSLAGLPPGITGSLTPSVTSGNTTLLNLAVAATVPVGSYPIEVRATGSVGVSATATITINVSP